MRLRRDGQIGRRIGCIEVFTRELMNRLHVWRRLVLRLMEHRDGRCWWWIHLLWNEALVCVSLSRDGRWDRVSGRRNSGVRRVQL